MKAQDLRQTLRNFNPNEPLSSEDELRLWYVERPRSPRMRLKILLETTPEPQKILFIGHRGSGKSTELNKLAEELEASFHTIGFNVLEITGRTSPQYEDLMLAISSKVTRYCIEQGLLPKPLVEAVEGGLQELHDWWQQLGSAAFR